MLLDLKKLKAESEISAKDLKHEHLSQITNTNEEHKKTIKMLHQNYEEQLDSI